jgi:DNA-binding transcriptional ArsR family regulator
MNDDPRVRGGSCRKTASSSRRPGNGATRPAQAAAFLDQLFGDREGFVAAALGVDGYFNDRGSYRFPKGGWRPRFFAWPQQRKALIKWAIKSSDDADVYVIPNLRSARSACNGRSLGSYYCWADIDDLNGATMGRLKSVLNEGSFIVYSGHGLHAYIRLDGFYPPDVVVDLNKRLANFLPSDSKWPDNALLRLPGCFNHKERARGGESFGVVIKYLKDSYIAPWTPEVLSELLGPLPDDAVTGSTGRTRKANGPQKLRGRATAGQPVSIVPVDAEPVPSDLPDEIRRLLRPRRTRGRLTDQSRSAQLHRLVEMCMSYGYRDGQVMGIAMSHEPAQEKWPNKTLRAREIQRSVSKLRACHPHVGRTCKEAQCHPQRSPEVIARIDQIKRDFDANYRGRTAATDFKIFDAVCQLALTLHRLEVGVSQRRLMELASIGNPNTLMKGLDRLSAAGYVIKSTLSDGIPRLAGKGNSRTQAHSYQLTLPCNHFVTAQATEVLEQGEHSPAVDKGVTLIHRGVGCGWGGGKEAKKCPTRRSNQSPCNGDDGRGNGNSNHDVSLLSLLDPALDMWRYTGLSSARLTYKELLGGITSVPVIASALGKDPRTIKRHLKALEQVGLAEKKLDGSWVAFERDPDEVAIELRTFGMGALQADRHSWESEQYQNYLEMREEGERREIQALDDERPHREVGLKNPLASHDGVIEEALPLPFKTVGVNTHVLPDGPVTTSKPLEQ